MSLETGESAGEVSEATPAPAASSAPETKPSSGYSVTDPGYDAFEADADSKEDILAQLRAENTKGTKKKPSETSDDASDADDVTEEEPEEASGDSAESSDDDGFSDELLDKAVALGYTLDDIKGFSDAKALETELRIAERVQKRLEKAKPPGEAETKPEEAKLDDELPEPKWEELEAIGLDPELIQLHKTQFEQTKKDREMIKQLRQAEEARAFAAQCERFDQTLDAMENFESIFGKGKHAELQEKAKPQAENRQKVFTKMLMLRRAYEQAGQPVPAERDLIEEAVYSSFHKQAQQVARKAVTSQLKKAGSQSLSRGRSAGSKPLSGPALAEAKEAEFWKKHQ